MIHKLHDLCYAYNVAEPVREMLFALQDRITELEAQCKQQAEPVHGDIRALKYRIHELEGEVMGYKRMLDVAEAASQPQQQAEPVGWKPIETAPKDEIVLLCLPLIGNIREGDRRVYEGRWHEAQATWTSVNGFLLFGAATNWMPLPQPLITAHGIKEGT